MNDIFGLIPMDGEPIHAETAHRMATGFGKGCSHRVWVGDFIALGQSAKDASSAPMETCEWVAAASACLENRMELRQDLGLFGTDRIAEPDEALVFDVCQRWGSDVTNHLLGDWCLARGIEHPALYCWHEMLADTRIFFTT